MWLTTRKLIGAILLLAIFTVGCSADTTVVISTRQGGEDQAQAGNLTEVIKFDPLSISQGDQAPVAAICTASEKLPGTYQCGLENGDVTGPCFVVQENTLICDPNPEAGSYQYLVTAADLPPAELPATGDRTPFFLQLETGKPPCRLYLGEPLDVAGAPVQYVCETANTWSMGLNQDEGMWLANLVTTDPATGEANSSIQPARILRAWVP